MNATKAAEVLNEMLALDHAATEQMLCGRTPCNEALAAHQTVQVGKVAGNNMVGLLGVVNGILLSGGSKEVVVMTLDDSKVLLRFDTKLYEECQK